MKRIAEAVITLEEKHMGLLQPLFVQILDDLIKADPGKGYKHLRTIEAIPDMAKGRENVRDAKRNDSSNVVCGDFPRRSTGPRSRRFDDGPLAS